MRWLLYLLLAVVSMDSFACVTRPRDPGWTDMLASARGAVVVRATKVESASDVYAIFQLERVETIADPLSLFRSRAVLGIETAFEDQKWHDRMTFWAGAPAGGVRTSTCAFFQHVDTNVEHVLLLGLDGPYALEPIAGKDDRWLKTVRDHFNKPMPRTPARRAQ